MTAILYLVYFCILYFVHYLFCAMARVLACHVLINEYFFVVIAKTLGRLSSFYVAYIETRIIEKC